MLTQATMQTLRALGLMGMAEAILAQAQQPDAQTLSFDERFGLLVDHEWTYRQNRRLARRLQEAKLPMAACVEDLEYYPGRGLDRALIQHLAQCTWVREHRACLICGATGTSVVSPGALKPPSLDMSASLAPRGHTMSSTTCGVFVA